MKTVRDVCSYIGSIIIESPLCIETGTMYTCPPGNEDHNTTNNIAHHICSQKKGHLWSFDIDFEHIRFSREFCRAYGCISWVEGDSVLKLAEVLPTLTKEVDFLCLDSKEFDEEHMVLEYDQVKPYFNPSGHFVLVDDIHNPNSVKYKKMVPILKDSGYSWFEVATPTGLFVAYKGYLI